MNAEFPRIDKRSAEDLLKEMISLVPFYTPEWRPSEEDAGLTLIKIFSQMLETVIQRLNRVPEKNFAAFLDMLGINLLPSQPAVVPVIFSLSEGTGEHVLIPAKTQVSADEIIFETERNIFATPSRLIKAYGIEVEKDEIYESPANVLSGETVVSFKAGLLYKAQQGNKQIFVSRSEGLNEGDNIIIGKARVKEYGIISGISDSRVKLSQKLKYDHKAESPVEKLTSFNLFEGKNIQKHVLYLGHEDLFNVKSETTITLKVTNSESTVKLSDPGIVNWAYWGEAIRINGKKKIKEIDWHPLEVIALEDKKFQGLLLKKRISGEIKELDVNKIKSRWIRCVIKDIRKVKDIELDTIQIGKDSRIQGGWQFEKLPPEAIRGIGKVFSEKLAEGGIHTVGELLSYRDRVDDLARIIEGREKSFEYYREQAENILENAQKRILTEEYESSGDDYVTTQGIFPDIAFYNDVQLDLGTLEKPKSFYPFGRRPRRFDTFYIACQECFSKKSSEIVLEFSLEKFGEPETNKNGINLTWEYWDGKGWSVIQNLTDTTENFTQSEGNVEFVCPDDIKPTAVNGQENYWIRVRIVNGDYGKEKYTKNTNEIWTVNTDQINPPIIAEIFITYLLGPQNLQHCLTYNNREYRNYSEEIKKINKSFKPFVPLEDEHKTAYLGFDKKLEKGPISIFFSLEGQEFAEKKLPKIEWLYHSQDNKWVKLDVLDNTQSFVKKGTVEFFIPADFAKTPKFGNEIFWIKTVDIEDRIQKTIITKGIYVNATYAIQEESIEDEILGSSDLSPNQKFQFTRVPVVKEEIWINEMSALSEEEMKTIIDEEGKDSIIESKDETGKTTEVWVKWQAVEDFLRSSSKSRHYVVDPTKGEIEFGDGVYGMVPPVGRDNIKATYKFGGGIRGNVGDFEVSTLKTSIPFVDKTKNPEAAEGGADIEQLEAVFKRAPQLIKHRDRAVTEEDFERLAKTASTYIARTKCILNSNKLKIIVIPHGTEKMPIPSLELLNNVKKHILQRSLNLISPGIVEIKKPDYKEVWINVDLVPESIDIAVPLEKEIYTRIEEFLHPLTGGPEKRGWEFGRDVHISDVYALIEGINGVDHVVDLYLNSEREDIQVSKSQTVCSGEHSIIMKFGG